MSDLRRSANVGVSRGLETPSSMLKSSLNLIQLAKSALWTAAAIWLVLVVHGDFNVYLYRYGGTELKSFPSLDERLVASTLLATLYGGLFAGLQWLASLRRKT